MQLPDNRSVCQREDESPSPAQALHARSYKSESKSVWDVETGSTDMRLLEIGKEGNEDGGDIGLGFWSGSRSKCAKGRDAGGTALWTCCSRSETPLYPKTKAFPHK